jgi:hypothetical protein
MLVSAPPLRTDPAPPVTFQDLMAEQLRHAPWLALSTALHGLVLAILFVLLPAEALRKLEKQVQLQDTAPQQVEAPPPPQQPLVPQPEPQPELTDVIELAETPVDATEPNEALDQAVTDHRAKQSAFASDQWNAAVGIAGGGGGRYGSRPSGGRGPSCSRRHRCVIDASLQWLRDHQDDDGKWDCDGFMKHDTEGEPCSGPGNGVHDVGVTGLALLAFLGEGSTLRAGPYREAIRKGVLWLREQQQENGLFGSPSAHDFVYDHAIAAYAMCEAYGLSNYQLLKPTAQKGLDYLESHRNPYSVWRYQPRDNDNDTSVTGWCIMAYESGRHFGLAVSTTALQVCATWLDLVGEPDGRHGYTKAGERSSRKPGDHKTRFPIEKGEAMTAVALFSRFFLGQDPKDKPIMKAAADLLVRKPPVWDPKGGAIDHYYWYYATYALFQMGGKHWDTWQRALETAVVGNQHHDKAKPNLFGSWDPACAWGDDGGRVYSTAILTLTLQAHYRYTKLVR